MDYDALLMELELWWGKPLPDCNQCPVEASYIVKLFKYYRDNK